MVEGMQSQEKSSANLLSFTVRDESFCNGERWRNSLHDEMKFVVNTSVRRFGKDSARVCVLCNVVIPLLHKCNSSKVGNEAPSAAIYRREKEERVGRG